MRLLWKKVPAAQLDLLDAASQPTRNASTESNSSTSEALEATQQARAAIVGLPLCIPIGLIDEDPNNPRTEFPDADIDELADDVRQRGILQPLVVHPADAQGCYRLHFGAKRLRAALRAGLSEVPIVVRDTPADAYDQIAENQKRHALSPLDLARFIQGRVEAGESNAEIARRLGMNLTTVAHHLSLLDLQDDQAIRGHLQRHDFSRWVEHVFRDGPLAARLRAIEGGAEGPEDAAGAIAQAIRARYEPPGEPLGPPVASAANCRAAIPCLLKFMCFTPERPGRGAQPGSRCSVSG